MRRALRLRSGDGRCDVHCDASQDDLCVYVCVCVCVFVCVCLCVCARVRVCVPARVGMGVEAVLIDLWRDQLQSTPIAGNNCSSFP